MTARDTPPDPSPDDAGRVAGSKSLFGWLTVICAIGVVIPPMVGLVGTAMGMVGAFGTLHSTGSADPAELAGDISMALLTTFWGMIFAAISFVPFLLFLILYLRRRKSFRALTRE